MHLAGFNLNHLVALDILLTERNVTRAADRLNLSQSAVSGALARLRKRLGDQLLVRDGHHLVPTQRAEELAPRVSKLLRDAREIIEPDLAFKPEASDRRFTVAMSDYAAFLLMPGVFRRVAGSAPGVLIEVLPIVQLRRGVIEERKHDMVVTIPEFASASHPMKPLLSDRWVCAVSTDSRFTRANFSLDAYLGAEHVAVRFGDGTSPVMEDWQLRRLGVVRKTLAWLPYFCLLPFCVQGTSRIATVQERFARTFEKIAPIRILPHPADIPDLQLVLQWHSRADMDPSISWLRTILEDVAASVGRRTHRPKERPIKTSP